MLIDDLLFFNLKIHYLFDLFDIFNLSLLNDNYQIINFTFKFLLTIAFLILIRGGTPRYRYDFLTKLGWLKFLNLNLLAISSLILLILVF